MCGINGMLCRRAGEKNLHSLKRMNSQIIHRGPDEEGLFADEWAALGMRRLAIIDLSTGSQPIFNETGRLVIVFNGEIYNYKILRKHMVEMGHVLKTESDTEVVLHLYEEYGEKALDMLSGMFAFAIYDRDTHEVFIARDRAGEKPLYYSMDKEGFYFSSELKAITKGLGRSYPIDKEALNTFLALTYIPAPMTIFDGVRKLPAGHWLRYRSGNLEVESYWDVKDSITDTIRDRETSQRQIRKTMTDTVEAMMVSDVPLGAFLSGGVDSTIVTGLMSKISPKRISTFSVGFTVPDYDETDKAMAVSAFHGTDHHVITLDYSETGNWLERILDSMDEPFADSSCIPTYFVSQFARNHVKVVLTGDGGDEMFAGYSKYLVDYYVKRYNRIPRIISESLFEPLLWMIPDRSSVIRKLKKVVRNKDVGLFEQRKGMMKLGFLDTEPLLMPEYRCFNALDFIDRTYRCCEIEDELTRTLYTDMQIVLEGDMLVKVDRMSMLTSLETRAPFLSKEMMELAFRLPSELKIQGKNQKVILKETFSDLFPKGIMNQTKQGFGVPVGEWFRGPLKTDLLLMLNSKRLEAQGIFKTSYVEQMLHEHFSCRENHGFRLWTLYVFQKWFDNFQRNGVEGDEVLR